MRVLVIIPAYNEQDNIEKVVKSIRTCGSDVDYLVINDCSTDRTQQILSSKRMNYLNLPVNLGIGGAVQAGYRYACEHGYDVAIQVDGDGQHDPAYISDLVRPIAEGQADMVIGSRFIDREGFQSSAMRRAGIRFLSGLIRLMCGVKVHDVTSGFRATNRALTAFYSKNYAQDYPEPEAVIAAVLNGFKITEVPVVMREREGGTSSIHSFRVIYYMIKVSLTIIIERLTTKDKRK